VTLEDLYRRSPYPVRVAMASGRGAVLRRRRTDRSTPAKVDAALDRERWTADRWEVDRAERLDRVLAAACEHVPAYREVAERLHADRWHSLPVLDKQRLRADPGSFVRNDTGKVVTETTSGTSGTPLRLVISRDEYREWYALVEARWRRWYGVDHRDRWGIVGGQPIVPPGADGPPYWVWNAPMRQLYLSAYHVAPRTAADYVRAIERHRLRYLLGYPSSIHALAVACRTLGVAPRGLRVVIGNAEPVLDHQREVIEEVFGCPVRETYGMAEYVAAASECEAGRMHLWPEVGVVEVLEAEADRPVEAGVPGRLVATSLLNATMPLLRYAVGDQAALAGDATCTCGRTLPVIDRIEGRIDDLVTTADGRVLGRLDPVFKGGLAIAAAQIVQEDLGSFRVLVVPVDGYDDAVGATITQRLIDRVGPASVEVEEVDAIPTGANGKFKAVVSLVAPGDR
jgi:phenylacetate-CoA ligase